MHTSIFFKNACTGFGRLQVHCLPIRKEAADAALRSEFHRLVIQHAHAPPMPASAPAPPPLVIVLVSSDTGFSPMLRYARQNSIACVVVGRFGRQTNAYQKRRGLKESELALEADIAVLFEDLA